MEERQASLKTNLQTFCFFRSHARTRKDFEDDGRESQTAHADQQSKEFSERHRALAKDGEVHAEHRAHERGRNVHERQPGESP